MTASCALILSASFFNSRLFFSINSSEAFNLVEYSGENASKLRKEVDGYMNEFLEYADLKKHEDISFVATSSTPLRLVSMINDFGEYDREKADGLKMNKEKMENGVYHINSPSLTAVNNPYKIIDIGNHSFHNLIHIITHGYREFAQTKESQNTPEFCHFPYSNKQTHTFITRT